MFWKKDRMERATDGAKFAVVFMIVIAISSLILNAPPPITLYVEACICTALLNNYISTKRYHEYDIYDKSLTALRNFVDKNKIEIDGPFGKVMTINNEQIENIPDPVNIPNDTASNRIYAISFAVAIVARIVIVILVFAGKDIFNNVFAVMMCLLALIDGFSYFRFHKGLHNMRILYMNTYAPMLLMRMLNNLEKIETQTKE